MEARDQELKKELDATLQARRELGPEYESALVDSFLEKVEQRLDGTVDRRVRRRLAEQQMAAARSPHGVEGNFGERFGFGIITMILAVPLSAIGAAQANLEGLVVAWAGIVGINAVYAAKGLPWFQRRQKSDWDD